MLDYITIRGFRSIASIEKLAMKPINVLIGANGSGKSNFVGVFGLIREISEGRLANYVAMAGGAEKILHFGSKVTGRMDFRLDFCARPDQTSCTYEVSLEPTPDDQLFISSCAQPSNELLRDRFRTWSIYHLHDTWPMRKTARLDDNYCLRSDGSNLAAFLYYLRERHPGAYRMIVRIVQQVVPFLADLQLNPLQLKPDDIKIEWRNKKSDQNFDAASLSDGTLRFIALATLFLQPPGPHLPSLILIEEPELGLHPYAVEKLAAMIRKVSIATQVIVSTQSPLLVNYFDPEEVLVADLVDNGTQLKRLESSELTTWLEDYSLGQLWEMNEFGGQPVHG